MKKIILIQKDGDIAILNEEELKSLFWEKYEEHKRNGGRLGKGGFYWEMFQYKCLNGQIEKDYDTDKISFAYTDDETERAYNHLESCIKRLQDGNDKRMTKSTLAEILSALEAVGTLTTREADVLYAEYCSKNKDLASSL